MSGFKNELNNRKASLEQGRRDLETLYAVRIEDSKMDDPEHAEHKEKCMVTLRGVDSTFQSFAGSIKSVRAVLETSLYPGIFFLKMKI